MSRISASAVSVISVARPGTTSTTKTPRGVRALSSANSGTVVTRPRDRAGLCRWKLNEEKKEFSSP